MTIAREAGAARKGASCTLSRSPRRYAKAMPLRAAHALRVSNARAQTTCMQAAPLCGLRAAWNLAHSLGPCAQPTPLCTDRALAHVPRKGANCVQEDQVQGDQPVPLRATPPLSATRVQSVSLFAALYSAFALVCSPQLCAKARAARKGADCLHWRWLNTRALAAPNVPAYV